MKIGQKKLKKGISLLISDNNNVKKNIKSKEGNMGCQKDFVAFFGIKSKYFFSNFK